MPSSFNSLQKKCGNGDFGDLPEALGDLQWYRKVRELRTEWSHFSSIFIAKGDDDGVLLCVRSYRRPSGKIELIAPNFTCTIEEFLDWVKSALFTLDKFAGWILHRYVLPKFSPEATFISAIYDESGFPKINDEHKFETEKISIAEYLGRAGLVIEAERQIAIPSKPSS